MTDMTALAALQTTAMKALLQTWLLSLPTAQPASANTPWLDAGTLRVTPAPAAHPALMGADRAMLDGPTDAAPLLSPTGV